MTALLPVLVTLALASTALAAKDPVGRATLHSRAGDVPVTVTFRVERGHLRHVAGRLQRSGGSSLAQGAEAHLADGAVARRSRLTFNAEATPATSVPFGPHFPVKIV